VKRYLLIIALLSFTIGLSAQKEGDQWVIGYASSNNPEYSVMNLDFSTGNLKIIYERGLIFHMKETCSNICDNNGIGWLWTNGMQIQGKNGISIADTIADFNSQLVEYFEYNDHGNGKWTSGFSKHDGSLILPVPDHEDEYEVIYHSAEWFDNSNFQISDFFDTRIKFNPDLNLNEILFKDRKITPLPIPPHDQWFKDAIKAIRHANGRDWWIFMFEAPLSKNYIVYLLDPLGLNFSHIGSIDINLKDGLGNSTFSSNGNYLARMDATTINEGQYITLYEVDRCEGDLIRKETLHTVGGFFTGVAFSPSERFLYADDNTHLWQWDLWADNISSSQTLIDTFDGFVQPGWFVMDFGPLMSPPDGRVYIVPSAGSSKYLHVINRPDLPGKQCDFQQHSIELSVWNARSAPNIPNYRLGPIDGSLCDTLGLNNLPKAWWRYEDDVPGFWLIQRFTDLSYFNPTSWFWDFDDGSTSSEQHPVHTFEPGLYLVCLTVSNELASDSSCHWIEILPTGIHDSFNDPPKDISILPNPFSDQLIIESKNSEIRNAWIQLYDMHGRSVFNHELLIPSTIYLPDFPPGIYLCTVTDADGSVSSMKLMKE
jgi:hypothetical protein